MNGKAEGNIGTVLDSLENFGQCGVSLYLPQQSPNNEIELNAVYNSMAAWVSLALRDRASATTLAFPGL